jgi:hypothetical protein
MRTTSRALDQLLRAVGDPIADLQHIGAGHAEFHRAQIVRAAAGVLAKVPHSLPAISQAVATLDDAGAPAKLRAHLSAAQAWLAGDPVLAAERYAAAVQRWPHDLLALRLAQSCYFFLGEHEQSCRIADLRVRSWGRGRRGFGFVLAMASFAHAEGGDAAYAESLGHAALSRDPACPLGVHAVAHAIAESGRHGVGARWMRAQRAHWAGPSRMRTHNAWHLAMFDAGDGHIDSAIAILDTCLLPAADRWPLDACDAAGLLWRITREGVDGGGRWRRLSDAFARVWRPGFWPYVDLHAALVHLSAGDAARVEDLGGALQACAREDSHAGARARQITLPALRAMCDWAAGSFEEAATRWAALKPALALAGGSRMQLEVFASIERDAVRRQRLPRLVKRPSRPVCATWQAESRTRA